jgi:CheY-like chemotaxis protein/anti-sigma regulatory factor (Ser/Thr protein kinase)
VDLGELIDRCVLTLRAGGRLGDRRLAVSARPVVVEADPARLEQVLTNLLDNAIKYTPPAGAIEVGVEPVGAEAVLTVRDTGIGLAPDVLPTLFEPFTQVERSLDRTRGGLGLGLTLVKRLVELHDGRVSAASPGLGRGSEFTVRIPLAGPPARPAPPDAAPAACGKARRVLIVEDNPDVREALSIWLESRGHQVEATADGERGLALILGSRPDIALVDVGLPGLDGYAIARRIRATPGTESIRLVALTGYGQPEDRREAMEAGFDAHLVKPVDEAALLQLLVDRPMGAETA